MYTLFKYYVIKYNTNFNLDKISELFYMFLFEMFNIKITFEHIKNGDYCGL